MDPESSITLSRNSVALPSEEPAKPAVHTAHHGKLDAFSVALYVENTENPVILQVVSNAFLGRVTTSPNLHPLLDLGPFDAHAKGVSRTHAVIQRQVNGFTLMDLNSSNGTWVNDSHLQPQIPQNLHSGDVIRLSNLSMVIYLPDETAPLSS